MNTALGRGARADRGEASVSGTIGGGAVVDRYCPWYSASPRHIR